METQIASVGKQAQPAEVIYPGGAKGRASIEVRRNGDGTNELFLVPNGSAPIPTGVSFIEDGGRNFVLCRIRKQRRAFKPEEVIRQKVLNWLIDDLGYSEERIGVEVGVQMGSSIHEKPADIIVFDDT